MKGFVPVAIATIAIMAACSGAGGGGSHFGGGGGDDAAASCDGPCPCTSDSSCSGATPRCDKNTGRCVPCLPTNDNCGPSKRCVAENDTYVCAESCKSAADCPHADGGPSPECCDSKCIDTGADKMNCGACGMACPAVANGAAACRAGKCGLGACNAGYTDCNNSPADGCETATGTDVRNCGGCGNACVAANGTPVCVAGKCAVGQCNNGYTDCNMSVTDGCESNTANDPANCGKCGNACPMAPHSAPACNGGVCSLGCSGAFADCNQRAQDGCEIDTGADVMNCGGCGSLCGAVANGTPGCAAGKCGVAACNGNFGDCNFNGFDGCEANLLTDVANCGGCGIGCGAINANANCNNGNCGFVCKVGFGNCDGQPGNGCEINLNTDKNNCGACGRVCGANLTCTNGVCVNANPCRGVAGGAILAAMGTPMYGACWYLSATGRTCDAVCAAAGGVNQANALVNAFVEDCNGGANGQPSTWFFQNGNRCGWTGAAGAATGYRTLGHGYSAGQYYGKCANNGGSPGTGTFPGDTSDAANRCTVCACSQ